MLKCEKAEESGDDRFARLLLWEGRMRVGVSPKWQLTDNGLALLRSAHAVQSLHISGPPLDESLDVLIFAVGVVYRFAWLYLNPPLSPIEQETGLTMTQGPQTADEHFSADLAFRFLPGLYHRIMGRNPQDQLAAPLKQLLRAWPLSGVSGDISEPPLAPPAFNHLGLAYLYSQRLAKRERPGWQPSGSDREAAEVVRGILGKPLLAAAEAENPSPNQETEAS